MSRLYKPILYSIFLFCIFTGQGFSQGSSISKAEKKAYRQKDLFHASKLARSAESKGDHESALKYWIEVNQIKPGYFSASKGIRRALVTLGRYDEAIEFLDTMLIAAQSGTIRLDPLTIMADQIDIYISSVGYDNTKPKIEEVLSKYKGNQKIYRELSGVLAVHRLTDDAIAMLYRGRDECGQEFTFARDLARWYESRMDWEMAVKEYLLFLYESDKNLNFVTGAIGDFISEPKSENAAIRVITAEINSQDAPRKLLLRKLLASLHFRAGRFKDALHQYQLLDRQSSDQGKELLDFAKLTLLEGEFQFAREAYDEILNGNPTGRLRADVLLGKAEALLGMEKPDSAVTVYLQAIVPGIPPKSAFEAYSRIGTIEFEYRHDLKSARKNLGKALEIGTKLRLSSIVIDDLKVKIALTYEFDGDLKKTEEILTKLIRKRGAKRGAAHAARFELSKLYFRQGDIAKADEMFTSLLLAAPSSESANEALRMKSMFNDLVDYPEVISGMGRADLAKFQGNHKLGIEILDKLSADNQGIIKEEVEWQRYELFSDAGFDSSALNALENIITLEESLRRDLALFTAGVLYAEIFKDEEMAIELLEQILTEHPNSLLIDRTRHLIKQWSEKDI